MKYVVWVGSGTRNNQFGLLGISFAMFTLSLTLLPLSNRSPNPRFPVTVLVTKLPSQYFGLTGLNER